MPFKTQAKLPSKPPEREAPIGLPPHNGTPSPQPSRTTSTTTGGSLSQALGLQQGGLPTQLRMALPVAGAALGGPAGAAMGNVIAEPIARTMEGKTALPSMEELSTPQGQMDLFNWMLAVVPVPGKHFLPHSKLVDKEGNLKRVLHGTSADFKQFDPAFRGEGAGGDLYGPGYYFTEGRSEAEKLEQIRAWNREIKIHEADIANPATHPDLRARAQQDLEKAHKQLAELRESTVADPVTNGYAYNNKPHTEDIPRLREQLEKVQARYDHIKQVDPDGMALETTKALELEIKYLSDIINNADTLEAKFKPNVRPHYLDIRNEFDMDADFLPEDDTVQKIANRMYELGYDSDYFLERVDQISNDSNILGKDIYHLMLKSPNENNKVMGKADANQLLQSIGFDGITHIGGQNRMKGRGSGPQTHRVWIAFHPEQIHGAFDLESKAYQRSLQIDLPPHNPKKD